MTGPGPRRRPHYALGDTPVAGDRLALLAEMFRPATEAFVRRWAPRPVAVAVDLGCGPGHTTALVAEAAGAEVTVGLDASLAFVARAATEHPGIDVRLHDATVSPLPIRDPDLIFCRYLLAHLPDPQARVADWCGQLPPGARLLIEEAEDNESSLHVFTAYQRMAGALIAHYEAELFAGRLLAGADPPEGTRRPHSAVVEIRPRTAIAARLFLMNLETWRHDPWVAANVAAPEVEALAGGLEELCTSEGSDEMVFRNRQIVYEAR